MLAVALLATYVLRGVFEYFKSYVAHVMAWNYVSDLRVALYDHLQKLSLRYYSDKQTGEIMSRVVNDTTNIEPLIAHNIPDLIVNVTVLAGITGILIYLSPQLAFLTLIPIPLLVAVIWFFSGRMRAAFRVAQTKLADLNAVLQDNISGIKEIQVFTREPTEQSRVTDRSQGYTVKLLRALRIIAVYHPSVEIDRVAGHRHRLVFRRPGGFGGHAAGGGLGRVFPVFEHVLSAGDGAGPHERASPNGAGEFGSGGRSAGRNVRRRRVAAAGTHRPGQGHASSSSGCTSATMRAPRC